MIDLTPIAQPILAIAGTVLTGLAAIYVPKAIAAFQARTGIELTDQQRATVIGAVNTAAGMLETKLDQGVIQVAHVNVGNAAVQAEAQAAINAVPQAMAALQMTPDSVARMIVGATNTKPPATTPAPAAPGA